MPFGAAFAAVVSGCHQLFRATTADAVVNVNCDVIVHIQCFFKIPWLCVHTATLLLLVELRIGLRLLWQQTILRPLVSQE